MFSKLFALEIHHIATFCTTFTHFGVFIISQTPPKRKGVSENFLFFYQLFSLICHTHLFEFHIMVIPLSFYSFVILCLLSVCKTAYSLPSKNLFLVIFTNKKRSTKSIFHALFASLFKLTSLIGNTRFSKYFSSPSRQIRLPLP